jgi:NAD(P)-dependent dehydrogenase (short-subunit alcohol dehydrogenase family)
VEWVAGDLASQAAVRALAADVAARHAHLHVLVNNAGVCLPRRSVTPDGIETTFAVNHLAPFLLTHLLLDRLRAGSPARIVTVTSAFHRPARLDPARLDGPAEERRYSGLRAYSRSKLANVLFTYELARRLEGTAVTATCVHPGYVRTGIGTDSVLFRLAVLGLGTRLRSPEQGAGMPVLAAAAPELEGVSGRYLPGGARPGRPAAPATRTWRGGCGRGARS